VTRSYGGKYLFKRAYLNRLLFEQKELKKFMTGGASLGFQH
jgi:hypothetical protein